MAIKGFVDPSMCINTLRGGEAMYLNQAFGNGGAANDDGHAIVLPSTSTWAHKCTRMYNLKARGVTVVREVGHDPQAWQEIMARGADAVAAELLEELDAAQVYGLRCIFTLGGLSDKNTWAQAKALLDTTSPEFEAFAQLAAKVADAIGGHPALMLLEALNEADFMAVITGHWLKAFPAGGLDLVRGFSTWQVALLNRIRALQKRPGSCPLGNGTAMDSSLYCNAAGVPAMPWNTELCIKTIIPLMAAGCDVWTPHLYQHEDNDNALLVLERDKLASFIKAAQLAGKQLVLGECGGLYRGGIWTPKLQAVYDRYPDLITCWMIRDWNPQAYAIPAQLPTRVPYSPAPVNGDITPPSSSETTDEPSDTSSSPPAQEPDTPTETPGTDEKPADSSTDNGNTVPNTPAPETPAVEPKNGLEWAFALLGRLVRWIGRKIVRK